MPVIPDRSNTRMRRFLLAGLFGAIHTAVFAFVAVTVATSRDPEASTAYSIFIPLDYPVSRLYQLPIFVSSTAVMPVLGGLLWLLYGFVLQSLFSIRSISGLRRFGVGLLLLGLLCVSPDIYLESLPRWQEHWYRGTVARNANDFDKAIEHVSEAVHLSSRDNPNLDGMWDYLGRLYVEQKDYPQAEQAFTNALAAAAAKANSRPIDLLNAYNELAGFYRRTGDRRHEKECLRKAIGFTRIVYEGDSAQEADCWHRLAEIAHEEGNSAEANPMMEQAIGMYSSTDQNADSWMLDYMKVQFSKWTGSDTRVKSPGR